MENLPAAAYTCDAAGIITYFNQQAVLLWGRAPTLNDPANRFCGSFKLFSPSGALVPHDECWMAKAVQTGKEFNGHEIIIEKPDGRRVTVLNHVNPIHDESGRLVGAANVLVDITERKQAERAREQMAAIIESSRDALYSETLEGRVVSWNRGAEKIFGFAAGEVIGYSIADLVPFNHADEMPRILAEIRQGQAVSQIETVRKTKDGRLIDVALSVSPIRNDADILTGVSTIAHDITERRQLQKRLRESAELFHQLAANIGGYLWLNAPDDSQMFYMSPAYEKLTGRKTATLYGHPASWTEIIHPDDRDRVLSVAQAPINAGHRLIEYRIVRPDGAVRWIRDRAFPVQNAAGETYRIAGIGEDITEQRQAMDEWRESKKRVQALSHRLLAVREQERGRLARELHDGISQSLTSLAFAFEESVNAPSKMRKAHLNAARVWLEKGLRQAREMANDLRPPMLDHLGLLAAVLWLVGRVNSKKGLQVHLRHDGIAGRLAPDVEIVVYRLVEEALNNVAQHANVKEASVRLWIQDTLLNVQIEDEGVGFEPEAALASPQSAGLAGIREHVDISGGRLMITSGTGEGTSLLAQWPVGP
jgi:PAS domain S-box-containing protein